MRTRNVRSVTGSVQVSLGATEIRAIFAAINTAELVTAGVVRHPQCGSALLRAIEKIERASGVCRCSVDEWELTAEGERLPTVLYARKLQGEFA